jgi:hypothetical protein
MATIGALLVCGGLFLLASAVVGWLISGPWIDANLADLGDDDD